MPAFCARTFWPAPQRQLPEFRDFIRAVNELDYEYAGKMLAHSLLVSRVQTEARLVAGIRFPQMKADCEESATAVLPVFARVTGDARRA